MNNNFFPGLNQNFRQTTPPDQNRPGNQNGLNPQIPPAAVNPENRFRFGATDNVIFGQYANADPRAPAPPPRPRIPRFIGRAQRPAPRPFHFDVNMDANRAAQLLPPLLTNQPTPTVTPRVTPQVTPPGRRNLPSFVQPQNEARVTNLFANVRGLSDLGSYSNQAGATVSRPIPSLASAQGASMSMRATSNLGEYRTSPQQLAPQLPALSGAHASIPLAISASNDIPSTNGVQKQLTSTSSNSLPNGTRLSLFPNITANPPAMPAALKSDLPAAPMPNLSTQTSQPAANPKVPAVPIYKPVVAFGRQGKVLGGSRTHPCIKVMDPIPDLPASVESSYVKQMMTINMAAKDAISERFEKNPFRKLDNIVTKVLDEISALNGKFPGCKAAMSQLDPSVSKSAIKPAGSSSFQSTSTAAKSSVKPFGANTAAIAPSFKPPSSTVPFQAPSNVATPPENPITTTPFLSSGAAAATPFKGSATEGTAVPFHLSSGLSVGASNSRKRASEEVHEKRPSGASTAPFQAPSNVNSPPNNPIATAPFQLSGTAATAPIKGSTAEGTIVPFTFTDDLCKGASNARKRASEEEHEKRPLTEDLPDKETFSFKAPKGVPKFRMPLAEPSKPELTSGGLSVPKLGFSFGGSTMPNLGASSSASKSNFTFGGAPEPSKIVAPQLSLSFKSTQAPTRTNSNPSATPVESTSNTSFTFKLPNPSLFGVNPTNVSTPGSVVETAQDHQQHASKTQEANGSDDEAVEEEGFKGARTNDDLILEGEGEEEEEALAQARVKLLSLDASTKAYKDLGVGILKVNLHQVSGRRRLICRAEGSGRILINSYIPEDINAEVVPKSSLKFKAFSLDGVPTLFVARIKELSDAKLLQSAMETKGN